jgi:hypothetical protein
MCAWRMCRRFTMSVICMRERSSLVCTCTAKMETCEVSMSASTAAGISISGRGAKSSSTKTFHGQPRSASCVPKAAAIGSVARVGNQRDLLRRIDAQAGGDGGTRARVNSAG